jgi:hypothetical protein
VPPETSVVGGISWKLKIDASRKPTAPDAKGAQSPQPPQSAPVVDGDGGGAVHKSAWRRLRSQIGARSHDDRELTRHTTDGIDLADLVVKYRAAVAHGDIEQMKKRADTPPHQERTGAIANVLNSLRAARIRRKWRVREEKDDLFGQGYDIDWLKVVNSQPDEADFVGQGKLWIGKDYVNFIFKDFENLNEPYHGERARARPIKECAQISSIAHARNACPGTT